MFQNSYQGNSYFELFDAKSTSVGYSDIKERERPIFKLANSSNASKQFDKQLKGYTLDMQGATNRLVFPREEKLDLYLTQQYLNLQLFIQPGGGFALEIIITDSTKTKRRIIFSHVAVKSQRKPFFVKVSGEAFRRGRWLNLCVDVHSFINGFPGQNYRSLDQIYISGACRLKKIYTTQSPRIDMDAEEESHAQKSTAFLPSHFNFPPGVPYSNQCLRYHDYFPDEMSSEIEEELHEFKQSNLSSNASNVLSNQRLKETRKEFSTPKVEPLKASNKFNNTGQRKFLANTNSTEMMMRNRKEEETLLEKKLINKSANKYGGQQPSKQKPQQPNRSVLATTTKTNPELAKTRNNNTSIDKKAQQLRTRSPKKYDRRPDVAQLNPWRNDSGNQRQQETYVKEEIEIDDRDVKSANTTVFKKKNPLGEKGNKQLDPKLQTNSRLEANLYSDSEYFELSQKFSTITDPKFFKPQIINKMSQNMQEVKPATRRDEEEIEEAIEVDGTSFHETNRNPELSERPSTRRSAQPPLFEQKQTPAKEGFMEQHLRRMMGEIQRPYTPPIHSHDTKELERKPSNDSKQLELIYDHVLNCYYDFKTNTYYQLKP